MVGGIDQHLLQLDRVCIAEDQRTVRERRIGGIELDDGICQVAGGFHRAVVLFDLGLDGKTPHQCHERTEGRPRHVDSALEIGQIVALGIRRIAQALFRWGIEVLGVQRARLDDNRPQHAQQRQHFAERLFPGHIVGLKKLDAQRHVVGDRLCLAIDEGNAALDLRDCRARFLVRFGFARIELRAGHEYQIDGLQLELIGANNLRVGHRPVFLQLADATKHFRRVADHGAEPLVQTRLHPRPRRHRRGTPGIAARSVWVERFKLNGDAVSEAEVAAARRVHHVDVGRNPGFLKRIHGRAGAIEVPLHQLVDALGQQQIFHSVERVREFVALFSDRGALVDRYPGNAAEKAIEFWRGNIGEFHAVDDVAGSDADLRCVVRVRFVIPLLLHSVLFVRVFVPEGIDVQIQIERVIR